MFYRLHNSVTLFECKNIFIKCQFTLCYCTNCLFQKQNFQEDKDLSIELYHCSRSVKPSGFSMEQYWMPSPWWGQMEEGGCVCMLWRGDRRILGFSPLPLPGAHWLISTVQMMSWWVSWKKIRNLALCWKQTLEHSRNGSPLCFLNHELNALPHSVNIPLAVLWDLMLPVHYYITQGNLDIFIS